MTKLNKSLFNFAAYEMGNVTTNTGKNVINQVNNILTQITTNALATSTNKISGLNIANVQFGGEIINKVSGITQSCGTPGNTASLTGNVNINQVASSQVTLDTKATSNVAISIKANLASEIVQQITSKTSNESSWLSTAIGVTVNNQTNITNAVNNIVNNIDTNTSTSCNGFVYDGNETTLLFCAPVNGDINVNQSSAIEIASSCAAKLVFNAALSTTVTESNIQKAEAQVKNQGGGPFDFITNILYFFAFMIILIIIATVIMHISHSGKKQQQQQGYPPQYQQQYPPQQQ